MRILARSCPPSTGAPARLALCAALLAATAAPGGAQVVGGRVVRTTGGAPLAGVRVALLHAAGDSAAQPGGGATPAPVVVDSATSAADGVFYVDGHAPGTFLVRLRPPDDEGAEFDSPPIALAAGELVEREFVVAPARPAAPTAAPAAAAAPVAAGSRDGEPYFEFQVEQPARVLHAARPEFPRELLDRPPVPSADARVIVQFVVDVTGFAEMRTFKVLEHSEIGFIEPVRSAVARSRYRPARIGGRPVRQLVQQPYHFTVRTTGVGAAFRP